MLSTSQLANGKTLIIAQAGPEDSIGILDFLRQVGGQTDFLTFGAEGLPITEDQEAAYLRTIRDSGNELLLKGTVDGRIVSTLGLHRQDKSRLRHVAEFGVSVLAEYWGQGVFRRMFAVTLDWARAKGIRKINLSVHERNTRAVRIYKELGFLTEGKTSRATCEHGSFYAHVLMGMELD